MSNRAAGPEGTVVHDIALRACCRRAGQNANDVFFADLCADADNGGVLYVRVEISAACSTSRTRYSRAAALG